MLNQTTGILFLQKLSSFIHGGEDFMAKTISFVQYLYLVQQLFLLPEKKSFLVNMGSKTNMFSISKTARM